MNHEDTALARRQPAFILTGAFRVICRNHRYLDELAARGLKILVISPDSSRAQAETVLSRPGTPAARIDDIEYVSGTMDQEGSFNPGVFAVLQRWKECYTIVGAFAMEEMLVEPTGLLCDVLGLPSPGLRASRACRNKFLQRSYLDALSPRSVIVPPGRRHTLDLTALKYPLVVKPVARHASSGVVACQDADETAVALGTYPAHETLLLEEMIAGQEFSVESLVQNGEVRFASVTRKETTDTSGRMFVELAHTVPAPPARIGGVDTETTLLDANRRLLAALDYRDGVTHSEWRVTETGEPYLMEVASRTPGDAITLLYGLACGEPLEAPIVRIALGEAADYPAPRRLARQVYLEHPAGILRDVSVDWPHGEVHWLGEADLWPTPSPGTPGDAPTLRAVLVLKPRGSRLDALRSSDDRAVTFLIDADTEAELDALEQRVRAAITMEVEKAEQGGTGLPC